MDSRPHPSSLNCRLKTSHQIRAPTPVIDLAYENDDGWEILDHKTDQLPADGAEELAQRYTDQLGAYGKVWRSITRDQSVRIGLHAVRAGTVIWTDAQDRGEPDTGS